MDKHNTFLEKVKTKGNLKDLDEAKRATEVLFRTMRDVMTTEASERVAQELDQADERREQSGLPEADVEELWEDTNPLVGFLSKLRPQLKIKPENFLIRLRQEGNLPGADAVPIVKAIFSATKEELSQERIQEIAGFLPGEIRQMWEES
ncbi:MAG TPA: DUF2267 domain-containing protein [Candidatus Obscuribacterales bacterium]